VVPGTDRYGISFDLNPPPSFIGKLASQIQYTLIDLNGDGYPDRVYGQSPVKYRLNLWNPAFGRIVRVLDYHTGARTEITYKALNKNLNKTHKPSRIVVKQITARDGLEDPNNLKARISEYDFQNGVYNVKEREFRGFGQVTVTDKQDNTKTITYYNTDAVLQGTVAKQETYDRSGKLLTRVASTYQNRKSAAPWNGIDQIMTVQEFNTLYSGYMRKTYAYTYENLGGPDLVKNVTVTDYGKTDSAGNDLGDDLVKQNTVFKNVSYPHILGLLLESYTYDKNNATRTGVKNDYNNQYDLKTSSQMDDGSIWANPVNYGYDSYGNITSITNGLNQTMTLTYDDFFHQYLRFSSNSLGHTRELVYDDLMRVTDVIEPTGMVTHTDYDHWNRPTAVFIDNERAVRYGYGEPGLDNNGWIDVPAWMIASRQVAENEVHVATHYDGWGRIIQQKQKTEDANGNESYRTVNTSYGQCASPTYKYEVVQYAPYLSYYIGYTGFDDMPRSTLKAITQTWLENGSITEISDTAGNVTRLEDKVWVKSRKDAKGNLSSETYDGLGRLIQLNEPGTQSAAGPITKYGYVSGTARLNAVTDTNNNVISMEYDRLGRRKSLTDPDQGKITYTYDLIGNLTMECTADNVCINYGYDALNRLTRKSTGNGQSIEPGDIYYDLTYDQFQIGCLDGIKGSKVLEHGSQLFLQEIFSYDGQGRVNSHWRGIHDRGAIMITGYDVNGYPTHTVYPQNELLRPYFGVDDRINALHLEDNMEDTTLIDRVRYNDWGLLESYQVGAPIQGTVAFSYDNALRVENLTATLGGKTRSLSYVYDALGNVTERRNDLNASRNWTYTYDSLNRLKTANGPFGSKTYDYHPNGNIKTKEGRTYTYATTQPHAVTNDAAFNYTYDKTGHMVSKSGQSGAFAYSYDAFHRLAKIVKQAGSPSTLSEMLYDLNDKRIWENTPERETYYFFPEYEEQVKADDTVTYVEYFFFNGERVAERSSTDGNDWRWRLHYKDLLGSTAMTVDVAGKVWETEYAPFGELVSTSGDPSTKSDYLFNDKSSYAGLYYYGARYYDPGLGRFISPDSIYPGIDSQNLNPYAYCNNNPTSMVDPSGNIPYPGGRGKEPIVFDDTHIKGDPSIRPDREYGGWHDAGASGWMHDQLNSFPNNYMKDIVYDFALGSRMDEFLAKPYGVREYQIWQNSEEGKKVQEIIQNVAMGHGGGKLPGFIERPLQKLFDKILGRTITKAIELIGDRVPLIRKFAGGKKSFADIKYVLAYNNTEKIFGKVQWLNIDDIAGDTILTSRLYSLKEFAKMISKTGYDPRKAIVVHSSTAGGKPFTLIDGNHRLEAIRLLGYKEIPAIIVP
jgi:RHS repeat-associated protein